MQPTGPSEIPFDTDTIRQTINTIEAQIPGAGGILDVLVKLNEKDIAATRTAPKNMSLRAIYFNKSLAQKFKPVITALEAARLISIREDKLTKDIGIFLNLDALTTWSPEQNPVAQSEGHPTPAAHTPTDMPDDEIKSAIATIRLSFKIEKLPNGHRKIRIFKTPLAPNGKPTGNPMPLTPDELQALKHYWGTTRP